MPYFFQARLCDVVLSIFYQKLTGYVIAPFVSSPFVP